MSRHFDRWFAGTFLTVQRSCHCQHRFMRSQSGWSKQSSQSSSSSSSHAATTTSSAKLSPYENLEIQVPKDHQQQQQPQQQQHYRPKYSQVKSSFLRLALRYHPDRPGGNVDEFRKIRQAFESIHQLSDGTSVVKVTSGHDNDDRHDYDFNSQQHPDYNDENNRHHSMNIHDWFFQETGMHLLSFHMDRSTRTEIANDVVHLAPGGLDKGGMWALAQTIAQEEAAAASSSHPNQVILQLEPGETPSTNRQERRRRRQR